MLLTARNKITEWVNVAPLVATVCWALYWLAIATMYCVPNSEDFALAIDPRDHGLLSSVVNLLSFFDSRYTTNLLHGLNPLAFNQVHLFVLMPPLCILLLISSFYYFISSFIHSEGRRSLLALYAVAFVVVHFTLQPSLPYGLFYMVSTFTYVYPWMLTFIWVGSLQRIISSTTEKQSFILVLVSYVSLVLSFGCSELFIPINSAILFCYLLIILFSNTRLMSRLLPYLILAGSSLLFIILCPSGKMYGDKVKSGLSGDGHQLGFIVESLKNYIVYATVYLLHPVSLAFAAYSVFFFHRIKANTRLTVNAKPFHLVLIALGAIGVSYLSTWIFFMFMETYHEFPSSIYNTVGILPQLALYIAVPLFIIKKFRQLDGVKLVAMCAEGLVGLLLFAMILLTENNINLIRSDYENGYLQDVKAKTEQFYLDAAAARKSGAAHTVVYLRNPEVVPSSIVLGNDVLPNRASACWNIAYEDYFRIDEVRLPNDTIFK